MYNDKYRKTKINLYNVNFYGNKASRENEHYKCLSVILLDSIVVVDKKSSTNNFRRMQIYGEK